MKNKGWIVFVVGKVNNRPNQVPYQRLLALTGAFNVIVITSAVLPEALNRLPERVIMKKGGVRTWLETVKCVRYMKRNGRPVSVYTQYAASSLIAGYLCKRFTGCPWVYDLWDHPSLSWANMKGVTRWLRICRWHAILKPMLRVTSVRVVGMQPGVLSYVPPPREECPIILTGPGYDENLHSACGTQKSRLENKKIRLVYVSALSARRGLQYIQRLVGDYTGPQLQLDIAGKALDMESKEILEWMRAEAESNKNLTLNIHGEIAAREAQELVALADIGIFLVDDAVLNYRYAYPVKLIEYFSHGVVCVATETDGVRSIITNNVNGFLCDSNYRSWAATLHRVISMFADNEAETLEDIRQAALREANKRKWTDINGELVRDLKWALRKSSIENHG